MSQTNESSGDCIQSSCTVDINMLVPAQREAVLCTTGPLLVLAGAGSGKTRVLTYRIAHMVADEGVRPWQILAITFTNKAASEMRERLWKVVPGGMRGMWVCTFHAMCVRMLREDAGLIGYGSNFTIYDDDDSKHLVRAIQDDLGIDPKTYALPAIRSRISQAKAALIGVEDLEEAATSEHNPFTRQVARVYRELDKRLKGANAMDFDDLLVKAYELLSRHPDVLDRYQERFRQISIDEYQDTNHVQYEICKLLAAKYRNLMVVGDDDQSIYSWRGADVRNIFAFETDYPDAHVVKLEQNFRSTGHILCAANAVVCHNSQRMPKRLYTDLGEGERVHIYQADNERDEGRWIGSKIEKMHDEGTSYDDIAVFYRTNAQSRILEDMLLRAGVPYRIVGGTRFFDRAEIRDVMAYLKLVINPDDDVSALRVVNTPRRGVGTTSIGKIRSYASQHGMSFFCAAEACVAEAKLLSPKVRRGVCEFTSVIKAGRSISGDLAEVVEAIVKRTGLVRALEAEHSDEAESRIENIREFFGVAAEFDETHDDVEGLLETLAQLRRAGIVDNTKDTSAGGAAPEPAPVQSEPQIALQKLPAFMEWLALRSDLDSLAGSSSAVTLMTIHSAKGLEFPVVFVAGMEEGLFPHRGKESKGEAIEEERRLAYVAITRAQRRLFLSYATTRRTYGGVTTNAPSRFLQELPEADVDMVGVGSRGFSGFGWEKRGDRHGTYGSGRGSDLYGGNVFGSHTRSTGTRRSSARVVPHHKESTQSDTQTNMTKIFLPGDHVSHKTFGPGIVKKVEGDVVSIRFERTGQTKKLLRDFAPLVKLDL